MERDDPKSPREVVEEIDVGLAPPKKRRLETPQERAQRLEKEKQALVAQIAGDFTGDLRSQVAYVLNHYPEARRSDKTLSIRVWETFYEERLRGGYGLEVLYELPAQTTITRTRAKIQNEYGLFRPADVVVDARKSRRKDLQDEMRSDKPDAPVISIYAVCRARPHWAARRVSFPTSCGAPESCQRAKIASPATLTTSPP